MIKHHGQIVERLVRRKNYSITDLARQTSVNRGMVYHWFNQKYLKADIIFQIGCVLEYDFSVDFPEFFTKNDFNNPESYRRQRPTLRAPQEQSDAKVWKDKYLFLLEKYSQLLTERAVY
ncbi:hypothetical protein GCM10023149_13610 [Mucilaginibacter gynuensis]|uniref:HTH cro/C1-type domain-containing protein n=1 Tax=Mucilaginibacter gynuensis TaxID=1302236 RepID=A0ABP8G3E2_9SPHI